jgi:hypothetical protein
MKPLEPVLSANQPSHMIKTKITTARDWHQPDQTADWYSPSASN